MKTINTENITQDIQQEELISLILQISMTFFILAIVFIFIMYLHNKFANRNVVNKDRQANIFIYLLFKYINTNQEEYSELISITHRLEGMLETPKSKVIFKQSLLSLHKLFEGDLKEKLENLYQDLGLFSETLTKLKKSNWFDKVEALNELKDLKLVQSKLNIKELILDSNPRVSIMAMQTLMEIDQHPFKFLIDYNAPITRAQAIFISKKAAIMEENQYKDVLLLLRHNQGTIVKLGIQMLYILKLNESSSRLVSLLYHADIEVQQQAFIVLAAMDPNAAQNVLEGYCEYASIKTLSGIIIISNQQSIILSEQVVNTINQFIKQKINQLNILQTNIANESIYNFV